MIKKCQNPPNDNENQRKKVRFNEKGNRACNSGKNNSDQKIYACMARMSGNEKWPAENSGDSSQLTNWILDTGATCHMPPEVSYFIPSSLKDTDKYIEVADGHHVTAKKKGQVQIKMCNNNRKTFIATLHNVLLAPELRDTVFSIITLIN